MSPEPRHGRICWHLSWSVASRAFNPHPKGGKTMNPYIYLGIGMVVVAIGVYIAYRKGWIH